MHFFFVCFSMQMILFLRIQAGYWILLKPNSHIPCPCLTMEDVGHHLWTIFQKPSHPGDPFIGEQFLILTFQTVRCFLLVCWPTPIELSYHPEHLKIIHSVSADFQCKNQHAVKAHNLPDFYQKAYLQYRTSLIRIRLVKELKQKRKISFSQASVPVILLF